MFSLLSEEMSDCDFYLYSSTGKVILFYHGFFKNLLFVFDFLQCDMICLRVDFLGWGMYPAWHAPDLLDLWCGPS